MEKFAVIIPVYNLSWMTINCLESIKATSDISKIKLIIIDNASKDKERGILLNYLFENKFDYFYQTNAENLGFIKAVNQGIKVAITGLYDYFFIMNNDIILTGDWWIRMLESFKDHNVAAVGSMTSPPNWRDMDYAKRLIEERVNYSKISESMESFSKNLRIGFDGQISETDFTPFFCTAFRTQAVKDVGYLDEEYYMGLFDDDDYCYRLIKKGYKIIERNFRVGYGEIDIIAKDGEILVFVEVKAKKGTEFGLPEEMISRGKLQKIRNTGVTYMQKPLPCRIDVVAIVLDSNDELIHLTHYENVY